MCSTDGSRSRTISSQSDREFRHLQLRLTFDGGTHLLAALTHACQTNIPAQLVVRTQSARIHYIPEQQIEIRTANVTESIPLIRDRCRPILASVHKCLTQGTEGSNPIATLEMARAHTLAINAASEASTVVQVPPQYVEEKTNTDGSPLFAIRDIEAALQACIKHGRMLHETGLVPWSRPAGDIAIGGEYKEFRGIPDHK